MQGQGCGGEQREEPSGRRLTVRRRRVARIVWPKSVAGVTRSRASRAVGVDGGNAAAEGPRGSGCMGVEKQTVGTQICHLVHNGESRRLSGCGFHFSAEGGRKNHESQEDGAVLQIV